MHYRQWFKAGNPYSTTRSRSLRLARRAGLRAHKGMCVRDADSNAKRGPETDLKMTTSHPMERARQAVKIAMLRTHKRSHKRHKHCKETCLHT